MARKIISRSNTDEIRKESEKTFVLNKHSLAALLASQSHSYTDEKAREIYSID
jgi:hypothetical protein